MTVTVLPVVGSTTLLLALASPATPTGSPPVLSVQGDAAAGHVTLQWRAANDARAMEFLLQQSPTEDFRETRIRYQGHHHASVISGLPNGSYYFRVRSRPTRDNPWGAWSTPQLFSVKHHSLALSLLLLGMGAVVFGLTLAFLLVSAQRASS